MPALVTAAALALVACNRPKPAVEAQDHTASPAVDKQAEERAIRNKERQWRQALTQKDSAAIGQFYAADGYYLPQESDGYKGPGEVSGRWLGERARGLTELEREPKRIEVADAGDMAYEVGTYKVRGYSKERGQVEAAGNYVTVWKKVGGDWKTAAYIWNRGAGK
jgi:ketosteroid isomerase-like protein